MNDFSNPFEPPGLGARSYPKNIVVLGMKFKLLDCVTVAYPAPTAAEQRRCYLLTRAIYEHKSFDEATRKEKLSITLRDDCNPRTFRTALGEWWCTIESHWGCSGCGITPEEALEVALGESAERAVWLLERARADLAQLEERSSELMTARAHAIARKYTKPAKKRDRKQT